MKITTFEQVSREIELPKYFKSKETESYYMVLDEESVIEVKDYSDEFSNSFNLYPSIKREAIKFLGNWIASNGIVHISEAHFKNVFLKVSLELEKLAN